MIDDRRLKERRMNLLVAVAVTIATIAVVFVIVRTV